MHGSNSCLWFPLQKRGAKFVCARNEGYAEALHDDSFGRLRVIMVQRELDVVRDERKGLWHAKDCQCEWFPEACHRSEHAEDTVSARRAGGPAEKGARGPLAPSGPIMSCGLLGQGCASAPVFLRIDRNLPTGSSRRPAETISQMTFVGCEKGGGALYSSGTTGTSIHRIAQGDPEKAKDFVFHGRGYKHFAQHGLRAVVSGLDQSFTHVGIGVGGTRKRRRTARWIWQSRAVEDDSQLKFKHPREARAVVLKHPRYRERVALRGLLGEDAQLHPLIIQIQMLHVGRLHDNGIVIEVARKAWTDRSAVSDSPMSPEKL
ncbi:hypothetical protein FB451DRAFT_1171284 [Mycena latifolia]|nr:hypothetical protein FB451DRAFT_1171284 [Mycena latifolia]